MNELQQRSRQRRNNRELSNAVLAIGFFRRIDGAFLVGCLGVLVVGLVLSLVLVLVGIALGWYRDPLVREVRDERIITNLRDSLQADPLSAAVVHTGDADMVVAQADGRLHYYDPATELWRTEQPFQPDQPIDTRFTALRHGCGAELDANNLAPCPEPDALWLVGEDGSLGRQINANAAWRILVNNTAFADANGQRPDQDMLTSATITPDGRYLVVGTRNAGIGLYDIPARTWLDASSANADLNAPNIIDMLTWQDRVYIGTTNGMNTLRMASGQATVGAVGAVRGTVVSMQADDALWVLTQRACEQDGLTCTWLGRQAAPDGRVETLLDERNHYPDLRLSDLYYAQIWSEDLVVAGAAGIYHYDPQLHSWRRLFEASVVDTLPAHDGNGFYFAYAGGIGRVQGNDLQRTWAFEEQPINNLFFGANNEVFVYTSLRNLFVLADDSIDPVFRPDDTETAPDGYTAALRIGQVIFFIGRDGATAQHVINREYEDFPQNALPEWMRNATGGFTLGDTVYILSESGSQAGIYALTGTDLLDLQNYFSGRIGETRPATVAAPLQGSWVWDANGIGVLDGAGIIYRIEGSAAQAQLGPPRPDLNNATLQDALAQTDGILFASGRELVRYDTALRTWTDVGTPVRQGATALELSSAGGRVLVRTSEGVLIDAQGRDLVGGTTDVIVSDSTLDDVVQQGDHFYLAGENSVQRYDSDARQITATWGTPGRAEVAIKGVLNDTPLWVAAQSAYFGSRALAPNAGDVLHLSLGNNFAWTVRENPAGASYLMGHPTSNLTGSPRCFFRNPYTSGTQVTDARALADGTLIVASNDGVKVYSPANRSWYNAPGNTLAANRVYRLSNHLVLASTDPQTNTHRASLIPLNSIRLPDSCASSATSWQVEQSINATALTINEASGRIAWVEQDGSVHEWVNGSSADLYAAAGNGPSGTAIRRLFDRQANGFLLATTDDAIWRYDLGTRGWSRIRLTLSPASRSAFADITVEPQGSDSIITALLADGSIYSGELTGTPATVQLVRNRAPGSTQRLGATGAALVDVQRRSTQRWTFVLRDSIAYYDPQDRAWTRSQTFPDDPAPQFQEAAGRDVLVTNGGDTWWLATRNGQESTTFARYDLTASDLDLALDTTGRVWRLDAGGALQRCAAQGTQYACTVQATPFYIEPEKVVQVVRWQNRLYFVTTEGIRAYDTEAHTEPNLQPELASFGDITSTIRAEDDLLLYSDARDSILRLTPNQTVQAVTGLSTLRRDVGGDHWARIAGDWHVYQNGRFVQPTYTGQVVGTTLRIFPAWDGRVSGVDDEGNLYIWEAGRLQRLERPLVRSIDPTTLDWVLSDGNRNVWAGQGNQWLHLQPSVCTYPFIAPTPTNTPTPSDTPTSTATATATPTATHTATYTPSATPTPSDTPTSTATATTTPTPTQTLDPTAAAERTPELAVNLLPTATITEASTATTPTPLTPSATVTASTTPSITPSDTPTSTNTPTLTPTPTPEVVACFDVRGQGALPVGAPVLAMFRAGMLRLVDAAGDTLSITTSTSTQGDAEATPEVESAPSPIPEPGYQVAYEPGGSSLPTIPVADERSAVLRNLVTYADGRSAYDPIVRFRVTGGTEDGLEVVRERGDAATVANGGARMPEGLLTPNALDVEWLSWDREDGAFMVRTGSGFEDFSPQEFIVDGALLFEGIETALVAAPNERYTANVHGIWRYRDAEFDLNDGTLTYFPLALSGPFQAAHGRILAGDEQVQLGGTTLRATPIQPLTATVGDASFSEDMRARVVTGSVPNGSTAPLDALTTTGFIWDVARRGVAYIGSQLHLQSAAGVGPVVNRPRDFDAGPDELATSAGQLYGAADGAAYLLDTGTDGWFVRDGTGWQGNASDPLTNRLLFQVSNTWRWELDAGQLEITPSTLSLTTNRRLQFDHDQVQLAAALGDTLYVRTERFFERASPASGLGDLSDFGTRTSAPLPAERFEVYADASNQRRLYNYVAGGVQVIDPSTHRFSASATDPEQNRDLVRHSRLRFTLTAGEVIKEIRLDAPPNADTWATYRFFGDAFPFDVVTGIGAFDGQVLVGTRAGLQVFNNVGNLGLAAAVDVLDYRANQQGEPQPVTRIGLPESNPNLLLARGETACWSRTATSTWVTCADPTLLDRRLRERTALWQWVTDASGALVGQYYNQQRQLDAKIIVIDAGRWPHDRLDAAVVCQGNAYSQWDERWLTTYPTDGYAVNTTLHNQDFATDTPQRLICVMQNTPYAGGSIQPGTYLQTTNTMLQRTATGWSQVTDSGLQAALADYAENPIIYAEERLRLRRTDAAPNAAWPFTFQQRPLNDDWQDLPWFVDPASERATLPIDRWLQAFYDDGSLWAATPSGLVTFERDADGVARLNPDALHIVREPLVGDAMCNFTDSEWIAGEMWFRCDASSAQVFAGAINRGQDEAVLRAVDPADDLFAARDYMTTEASGYWAWELVGREGGQAGVLRGTRGGGAALDALSTTQADAQEDIQMVSGEFTFDTLNSLALFDDGVLEVATDFAGWYTLPRSSLHLSGYARPQAIVDPDQYQRVLTTNDATADDLAPRLCARTGQNEYLRVDSNKRLDGQVTTCAQYRANDGIWQYGSSAGTLLIEGMALSGSAGRRVMQAGRFSDDRVMSVPITVPGENGLRYYVPTLAGVQVLDANFSPVSLLGGAYSGLAQPPAALYDNGEAPIYAGSDALYNLRQLSPLPITLSLPDGAVPTMLSATPANTLRLRWLQNGRFGWTLLPRGDQSGQELNTVVVELARFRDRAYAAPLLSIRIELPFVYFAIGTEEFRAPLPPEITATNLRDVQVVLPHVYILTNTNLYEIDLDVIMDTIEWS